MNFLRLTTSQILKRLMFHRGIRTTELARRIGLKQPTVHRIVEGVSPMPHLSSLVPLAEFFGITVDQLRGEEPLPWNQYDTWGLHGQDMAAVPVISWEEAMHWPESPDKPRTRHDPILMPRPVNDNVFALVMEDSSMTPQFPKGTILVIDPARPYRDRSYVLLKMTDHNRAVFRQLLLDARQFYLKCLSPDLDGVRAEPLREDTKICGTLIQARLNYEEG
jgi:SOS-response transcriptional repressor LexA